MAGTLPHYRSDGSIFTPERRIPAGILVSMEIGAGLRSRSRKAGLRHQSFERDTSRISNSDQQPMNQFLNRKVVVDVESLYVYLGELVDVSDKSITLVDADVHDLRDSVTTRERYVLDSKLHGIRTNRERVLIQRTQVVSLSALDDVVE